MKKLILFLAVIVPLSIFGQVKNYTIKATQELSTDGTFLYQGNEIDFASGILSFLNLPSNLALKDVNNNFNTTQSGTIFNATTGIQTGGTTRIDASGNYTGGSGSFGDDVNIICAEDAYSAFPERKRFLKIHNNRVNGTAEVGLQIINSSNAANIGAWDIYAEAVNGTLKFDRVNGADPTILGTNILALSSSGIDVTGNVVASGSGQFGDNVAIVQSNGAIKAELTVQSSGRAIKLTSPSTLDFVGRVLMSGTNNSLHIGTRDYIDAIKVSGATGNVEFTGTVTAGKDVIVTDQLKESGTFVSGFGGNNWLLDPNDNSLSHLTIDRLTVRDRMDVYELVVNQIRATNGSLWVSDAVKIETVSGTTLSVNDDTDITFLVNDIIKAQQFDGRNVRSYTAMVASVGATSFTVSGVVGTGWDGMELVRIGNTTNVDRQGALYLTSSDNNAPYLDVLDGVTSTSYADKTKVRLGKLDGITDAELGTLSGYGLYGDNVYLKGKMLLSSGSSISFADVTNATSEVTTITQNTVTSTYVNALDISASSITTGTLSADRIATGSLDADKITANTITANEIAANTITANEINATSIAAVTVTATNINALELDAVQGTIGAWNINNTSIYSGDYQALDDYTTSGMTIHKDGAIRAKNFRVDTDGKMYAIGGEIGGWNITSSGLTSGTGDTRSNLLTGEVYIYKNGSRGSIGGVNSNLSNGAYGVEGYQGSIDLLMSNFNYTGGVYARTNDDSSNAYGLVAESTGTGGNAAKFIGDIDVDGSINGIKTVYGSYYSNTDGNQTVTISGLTNVKVVCATALNSNVVRPVYSRAPVSGNVVTFDRHNDLNDCTVNYVAHGW